MAELVQSSDSSSDSEEERKRKRHRKKGKRSKHGHKKRSVMAVRLSVLCSYCWTVGVSQPSIQEQEAEEKGSGFV